MTEQPTTVIVRNTCMLCGQPSQIEVDAARYEAWVDGRRQRLPAATHGVQVIFSDLSPAAREILISGTHPDCFDKAFSGGEF